MEIDSTEILGAKLDLSHDEVVPALAHLPFDAYRSERMLMRVPDAERAFAEMVRVVRREAGYLCLILTGRLKWSIVMDPARSNGGIGRAYFAFCVIFGS